MMFLMVGMLQGITPPPQYVCPTCGTSFSSQAELDAHIASAHPAPLGYQCPYCDETFPTLQELINHVNTGHPDQPPIQAIDIVWE